MVLDPQDVRYIDEAAEKAANKAVKKYTAQTEPYLGTLMEQHRDEMKSLKELTSIRPTQEEVREIFREEIAPLQAELRAHTLNHVLHR